MKVFRLTYNEFVKQFKKISTKVIFILILLSAIAIPLVMNNIKSINRNMYNEESIKFNISEIETYISELENKSSQKDKISKKYAEINKEYNEILLEYKIGYDDWKMIEADEYKYISQRLANIEFVLEAYSQDIVLQNAMGQGVDEIAEYYKLKKDKKKEIEADFKKQKEELLEVIKTGDYEKHTQLEIQRQENFIAINQKIIDEYEKLKAKNPTSKADKDKLEDLKKESESAKDAIGDFEQDIEILKFRYDNGIDYSTDNWKNNAIVEIETILRDYRMEMLDEKSFNLDYNQSLTTSYEEYVEGFEKANKLREERMKELWYSLENNIPDLGAVKDARSVIDSTYEVFVVLGVVMSIIIGGSIVSNEFSTGSIRLLLIRPVARWKVLLAKLSLVLLVGYSIVILGTIILSVTSGFVFGFDTLDVPVLQTINGQIVEVDYFKYMILQLVTSTASLVFIASIVFMISTLSRNTALAVAVGMLLYIGVPFISQLLIKYKQIWILDTLIPYINSSYFRLMPGVEQELTNVGFALNYQGGAVQLLVVSVVVLSITFVTFMKRDIKN